MIGRTENQIADEWDKLIILPQPFIMKEGDLSHHCPRFIIEEFAANDRALAEGESVGRIKLLLDRKERPIGVQVLGPQAGDLIAEWVAIMNGGVGLSKIASAIHPYPTLGEINKRVIGGVFAPKIFSETVRKGLKFFFSFKGRACTCGEESAYGEDTMT